MRQQVKEIDGRPDQPYQVKDKMEYLMPLGPQSPAGRVDGIGGKIPVKIITADGGEKYKADESPGRRYTQQQFTRLPYHQHGAQGDVETAKNEKVEYFP
jgi:hypothetical protein